MSYPAAALQKAIYDALMADSALAAGMDGAVRAYDQVPAGAKFPYVTIADAQIIDDGNTCEADQFVAFVDLQVWSRVVGNVECKTIAGLVRSAIMAGVTPAAWTVTATDHRDTTHSMDPDGKTARARLNFRFLIQPT